MNFLRRFLDNHVLANLTFALVLILGVLSFMDMPRARDPDINLNWVSIFTVLPGAAAIDVEKRVTNPIEDAISRTAKDVKFVSSSSRDSVSLITVRFEQISEREFDKRVTELRREVQNVYNDQLPSEALDPLIEELNTATRFPTATVVLTAASYDEEFRRYSASLKNEFERVDGVNAALMEGVEPPELHIAFYPERLVGLGITPSALVDTVRAFFRDTSIGDVESDEGKWLVRLEGTSGSIKALEDFPILGAQGVVRLGDLADIYRAAAEPALLVRYEGEPAVMYSLTKQDDVNILEILDDIQRFIVSENESIAQRGYTLSLIDDQTISTRKAIGMMQDNALIGFFFVIVVTFIFLGGHISLLTSIGIPFTLAGTFIVLNLMGLAVNNLVLIGIVIALGMLVDDAVVVVEAIYYRLQRGAKAMDAAIDSLREVAAPVFTSVVTTIAVFLPLMLLPGIMGEYMRVIPLVVCVGLLISLVEAFWMLPAHVSLLKIDLRKESKLQRNRRVLTRRLRNKYSVLLIRAIRKPWRAFLVVTILTLSAFVLLATDSVKKDFFASDPFRVFYVNAELPRGANLEQSMAAALRLEQITKATLEPNELRASVAYSGKQLADIEPVFGDNVSQVFFSINPDDGNMRSMYEIFDAVSAEVGTQLGNAKVTLLLLEDGPPVGQPVSIKVRGKEFETIQVAVQRLTEFLSTQGIYKNVKVDFKTGNPEMMLSLKGDAIKQAGLSPVAVTRSLQSYVDGEIVNQFQELGEEVEVRLLAKGNNGDVEDLLQQTIAGAGGHPVALGELVNVNYGLGYQGIRHYNYQRTITVTADFDQSLTNTVEANNIVRDYWDSIRLEHPGITTDYTGELDDLYESLDGLAMLFVMGLGIVFLILGTQFKSYGQPLLVLMSVPLAFSGVMYGLFVTGNPLSLMTMYGVVALSGISVNAAIVLISAANARVSSGIGVLHATIFAARRRVIPILITSFTTVAGLFSMAAGFAGTSLVWGPVATAIISGLLFSTLLILIVIPLLYLASARLSLSLLRKSTKAS